MISSIEVIRTIDSNRQGLKKDEAKFYTGSINFSGEELLFINNDYDKIKQYAIDVFKLYASNFNKDINIDDVSWYAKIEANRYYKGDDSEVINGEVKQGDIKPGLNTHVHFIVGRKSSYGTKKLSPKTNHRNTTKGAVKGGFNRDQFKKDCETLFDNLFVYNRSLSQSYEYLNKKKKGNYKDSGKVVREQSVRIKYDQLNKEEKIKRLQKLINHINKNITKSPKDSLLHNELIIRNALHNDLNGNVYRSLINLNFKIIEEKKLPDDLNSFVLNYSKFLNQPYNNLPVSIKQDKLERYVFMLNRKIPDGIEKISFDKVLENEKSTRYSGKSFKHLNDVNRMLQLGNKDDLILKIDIINNGLESETQITFNDSKEKPFSNSEIFDDSSLNLSNHVFPIMRFPNYSYGNSESEEERKRKKKKKKRRDNDFGRNF